MYICKTFTFLKVNGIKSEIKYTKKTNCPTWFFLQRAGIHISSAIVSRWERERVNCKWVYLEDLHELEKQIKWLVKKKQTHTEKSRKITCGKIYSGYFKNITFVCDNSKVKALNM